MVRWWDATDRGQLEYSGNTLYQCHFVHHKSHIIAVEWKTSVRS